MITFDQLPEGTRKVMIEYKEEVEDLIPLETLKTMKKILNLCFGEENNQIVKPDYPEMISVLLGNFGEAWIRTRDKKDIKHQLNLRVGISVVIRFPKITITNSKKRSHDITDLWVKFRMMKDGIVWPGLTGLRTTVTREEFTSHYAHSHLRDFLPEAIGWGSFCLGEGPLNMIMARLRSKFSEPDFNLLCIHIKNYVVWESLEGTPHFKMEYIGANNIGRGIPIPDSIVDDVIRAIKSEFVNKLPQLRELLKVTVTDKKIVVEKTDELEAAIRDIICDWNNPHEVSKFLHNRVIEDYFLCRKTSNGEYVPVTTTTLSSITHQKTPVLNFKGQDIYFKVLNLEKNEISADKYPAPEITDKFCKHLSSDFTKAAIRGEILKEKSALDYLSTVAEGDFLSV